MGAKVEIQHFTDPACPFAFSAEPALLALRWHYGDQLSWRTRLVVLSERAGEYEAKGITLEMIESGDASLVRRFGMPINARRRPKFLIARVADTAIKAVQLNDPGNAEAFLRALRVAWMSDHRTIDEPEVLMQVAAEVGIDTAALAGWIEEAATVSALESDMRAARSPIAAATGPLDHKLGGPADQRRYTCPSLEIAPASEPEKRFAAPGILNLLAYEVLLANVAPQLQRRPAAEDPLAVLRWANWPLATAELAEVMALSIDAADAALAGCGAVQDQRGYWSLPQG